MTTKSARIQSQIETVNRSGRTCEWPQDKNGNNAYISDIFGAQVFTLKKMQEALPKTVYARFVQQLKGRQPLDKPTADAVAHAVRIWSMDQGATHFTHWFQPQTGTTAEKHDSFLTLKNSIVDGLETTTAIDAFSGFQLLQSEPDASSFPNGGIRTTFEARGYTIWDTSSPMFLRAGPHGTSVLYVPSVFISYNGDALDEKTILLRSTNALSQAAVKLLRVLGDKETQSVYTTLGTEQEFFLIDRATYNMRPDLKITGRTLIGNVPPKHQQLDDHYFGQIPSRVLACLSETELELYKLGVPIKTRHNEVAPNQFEMAPIYENDSVAVDHNLIVMETLHQVAHRHKLKALFHEKPFAGVNGSGKHCNFSMSTDNGENLLEPTVKPETNFRFLLVLVATLEGVHRHGGLLRACIASCSNEHRLGGNEAPPSIISAFLGEHLTEVLNSIEESRDIKTFSQAHLKTVKVGGTVLDLKVNALPQIARDLTDRNRTSPFAFTGNKFEFRAVGSKSSPSFPTVLFNSMIAEALNDVTEALVKKMGAKPEPSVDDVLTVVRQFTKSSKNIRFEGNGYSSEWHAEAAKRGLPILNTAPDAFRQLIDKSHVKLMTSLGIMTESEIKSRFHINMEKYAKDVVIESNTLENMVSQGILPSVYGFRKNLIDSLVGQKALGLALDSSPENKILAKVLKLTTELQSANDLLKTQIDKLNSIEDEVEQADYAALNLVGQIKTVRSAVDALEEICPDAGWPYPKYAELLF